MNHPSATTSPLSGLLISGLLAILAAAPLPGRDEPPPAPAPDVPFGLSLEGFGIAGLPGLHSFAAAGDAGSLVLLAGRTNGLHGFAPNRAAAEFPSFPAEYANDTAYLVDLTQGKLLGQAKVTGLPSPYLEQLQASNVEYLLKDGIFYVVGGYGLDPKTKSLVTLPFVTAIDFAALASTLAQGGTLDGTFAANHMASFQHPALAITGGDLVQLGDSVLLVYGHQFDGQYSEGGGPAFQQYSNSVRVFTFEGSAGGSESGLGLSVNFLGSVPPVTTVLSPENPFHRRDLTVKPAVDPTGNPRIGVYGGVFKGGRIEGYLHPIYIAPGTGLGIGVAEDTQASQLLSQYDCATLQAWSQARGAMYSTFFGGISQYYWDGSCQCLKRDTPNLAGQGIDGLPFVASISTLRVSAAGSVQFVHDGASFPPALHTPSCPTAGGPITAQFLGAETKLIPAAESPWSNGVLQLDSLMQKTVVGYLVGGIAAHCPAGGANSLRCYASTQGASCASNVLYRVLLDPSTPAATRLLTVPAN